MQVYGLKTCDTCRKVLKSLPDAEFVDVRADGVPEQVLVAALSQFGDVLINTRSTTWRGLNADQRDADPLVLLRDHPTLMKRPLISDDDAMYLGWGPDTRAALQR